MQNNIDINYVCIYDISFIGYIFTFYPTWLQNIDMSLFDLFSLEIFNDFVISFDNLVNIYLCNKTLFSYNKEKKA